MRIKEILYETKPDLNTDFGEALHNAEIDVSYDLGTGPRGPERKRNMSYVNQDYNPEAYKRAEKVFYDQDKDSMFDTEALLYWVVKANRDNNWNINNYVNEPYFNEIKYFYGLPYPKSERYDNDEMGELKSDILDKPIADRAIKKASAVPNVKYKQVIDDLSRYINVVTNKKMLKGIIDDLKINDMSGARGWLSSVDTPETKEVFDIFSKILKRHNLSKDFYGITGYNKIKGSVDD